jgi:sister-chromatid-cohesion protein PDS5
VQKELSEMEQELIDTASLNPLTKQLIANGIIHHKSDAVRASAACCLADLLRLYAPKAPYTASELKVSRAA